jgi:hypothetical protein
LLPRGKSRGWAWVFSDVSWMMYNEQMKETSPHMYDWQFEVALQARAQPAKSGVVKAEPIPFPTKAGMFGFA